MLGLGLVGVGAALLIGSRWHASPELALVSGVILGLGVAYTVAGPGLARQVAFPLGLLLLALPLASSLYLPWVHALEQATTAYAAWALDWLHVPAMRYGTTIILADAAFMVIETCSGAGAISILVLLAAFWAGVTRAPALRAVLLIGVAPVLGFALNGLRVLALILTPGSEGAGLHVLQGILLFQGGVLSLWLFDRLLARVLPQKADGPPAPEGGAAPRWGRAAACFGLAAAISVVAPEAPAVSKPPPWSMALPSELLGMPSHPKPVDHRFLGSLRFAWSQHAGFGPPLGGVDVFVASEDPSDPRVAPRSPKNRVAGRAHRVLSVARGTLGGGSFAGEEAISLHEGHRRLSWVLYGGLAPAWAEAVAGTFGLRPPALGTYPTGRVLRLTTSAGSTPRDLESARNRLAEGLDRFGPIFAAR